VVRFAGLDAPVQRELRRIWHELDQFGFVERSWPDRRDEYAREGGAGGCGRGARFNRRTENRDKPFVEAAGGAPVYQDIQQGMSGTRRDVLDALERFIRGTANPTGAVRRAITVAEGRVAGDRALSPSWLPEDAGDDPLPDENPITLARRAQRREARLTAAALKAWSTRDSIAPRPVPKPRAARITDPVRAAQLSAAANKAWATRRARAS
jgi:hypothetical protein